MRCRPLLRVPKMGCKNRHIQNGQLIGNGANGAINGKVGQFMGNGKKWGIMSNGAINRVVRQLMGEWSN